MALRRSLLAASAGAALGALARLGIVNVTGGLGTDELWLATLVANITGCSTLGLLHGSAGRLDPKLRIFAMTGFCGGLTTMSTFGVDTLGFEAFPLAVLYVALSLGLGVASFAVCARAQVQVTRTFLGGAALLLGPLVVVGVSDLLHAGTRPTPSLLIGFVIAAGCGGGVRAALSEVSGDRKGAAILAVNVIGTLLLARLTAGDDGPSETQLTLLGIGALGALTTFSTTISLTINLVSDRSLATSARYLGTTTVLVLLAAAAGQIG